MAIVVVVVHVNVSDCGVSITGCFGKVKFQIILGVLGQVDKMVWVRYSLETKPLDLLCA